MKILFQIHTHTHHTHTHTISSSSFYKKKRAVLDFHIKLLVNAKSNNHMHNTCCFILLYILSKIYFKYQINTCAKVLDIIMLVYPFNIKSNQIPPNDRHHFVCVGFANNHLEKYVYNQ